MALKYLNFTGLTDLVTNIMNWVTSRIPTKTSEIDNDSGYITANDLPTNHVTTNTTQTITSTKTFQNIDINLKQTGITLGTTPSSHQYRRVQSLDNSGTAFAQLVYVQRSDGNTYIELRAGDKFTSGAKATSGTQVWSDFQVGTSPDGNKYIYTDALWSNSLVPYGNNTSSLGNATHRWTNVYGTVRLDPSAGATADLLYSQMAANDLFRLQVGGTSNNGYVEIATADDGNEPIYVRQYKGVFATLQRTLTLLDGSGNTTLPGTLNAVSYKLNGTAFGDIVTHNASEFLTSHQSLSNYATKSYVDTSVANLVNSAPTTLDTLNELATALGNDPNFATTVATSIGTKANDSDVVHLAGTETVTGSKTFSNPINSSYNSSTWLNANNGGAIINSTATAGTWTCIAKTNSTNGHFTLGSHQANFYLNYTVGTETGNRTTKSVRLLDESGNSYFPGIIESGYVFGDGKAAFKAHINTATSTWSYGISILNAAMSANQYIFCPIGKAYSTANCAGLRFQWVANSSNDNNIGFEFYGTGSPLVVYKDGRAVLSASPDASDNSTRIATTAYVKSQGYITSSSSITGNAATATTAGNVTGTVAIANGGTGATTRVGAVKSLFNENIGSSPTHFLTGTANFANSGWSSIADTKTALGITGDIGTHNANEFLTSHQSLDGCVKTTGNQLIAGWKQFTSDVCIKNTAITDHTVAPSENTGRSLGFWDNNNKYWGDLDHTYYTSGVSEMRLCLSNWTSSGSQGWWCLKFGVDKNFSQVYFIPNGDDGYNLGDSTHRWHYVYANSFKGTLSSKDDTISYTTANAFYFYSGQPTLTNSVEGSSNDFTKFSYPTGGTYASSSNVNIQSLRLVWSNTYWHEIFASPNQRYLWHRDVRGGSAKPWTRLVEEDSTVTWGINIGGSSASCTGNAATATTAGNVTGTVAIANGGTGATTRTGNTGAVANLFGEAVSSPGYFLGITSNFANAGYTTIAQAKSKLGINMTMENNTARDCNTVTGNGIQYYSSSGPSTSIGASTNDGSLYTQYHNSLWINQIAQDYRNGNLFTRGKNNGTWQAWRAVAYHGDNISKFTNDSSFVTTNDVSSAINNVVIAEVNPGYFTVTQGKLGGGHGTSAFAISPDLCLPTSSYANAYIIDTTGWDVNGADTHVTVKDANNKTVPGYAMIYLSKCAATDYVIIQLTSMARSAGVFAPALKSINGYYYVKACFPTSGDFNVNIIKTSGTIGYALLYPFVGNHGYVNPRDLE